MDVVPAFLDDWMAAMSRFFTFQKITGMFSRISVARQKRKSLRAVGRLPDHIRDDIGWPSRDRIASNNFFI